MKTKSVIVNPKSTVDEDAVQELLLYTVNHSGLYKGMVQSILLNYARKIIRGTYDPEKAVIGWGYLADQAATAYNKEIHGKKTGIAPEFSKATRMEVARRCVDEYQEELDVVVESMRSGKISKLGKVKGNPEFEDTEPQFEDDYVISNYRGKTIVAYCGKVVKSFPEYNDDVEKWIFENMQKEKFYPGVWFMSDHGNYHMVDMTKYFHKKRKVKGKMITELYRKKNPGRSLPSGIVKKITQDYTVKNYLIRSLVIDLAKALARKKRSRRGEYRVEISFVKKDVDELMKIAHSIDGLDELSR